MVNCTQMFPFSSKAFPKDFAHEKGEEKIGQSQTSPVATGQWRDLGGATGPGPKLVLCFLLEGGCFM